MNLIDSMLNFLAKRRIAFDSCKNKVYLKENESWTAPTSGVCILANSKGSGVTSFSCNNNVIFYKTLSEWDSAVFPVEKGKTYSFSGGLKAAYINFYPLILVGGYKKTPFFHLLKKVGEKIK